MFLSKLFGTKSEREMKKLSPVIKQINQLYETLSSKSDSELLNRTKELREFVIQAREEKEGSLPKNIDKKEIG